MIRKPFLSIENLYICVYACMHLYNRWWCEVKNVLKYAIVHEVDYVLVHSVNFSLCLFSYNKTFSVIFAKSAVCSQTHTYKYVHMNASLCVVFQMLRVKVSSNFNTNYYNHFTTLTTWQICCYQLILSKFTPTKLVRGHRRKLCNPNFAEFCCYYFVN